MFYEVTHILDTQLFPTTTLSKPVRPRERVFERSPARRQGSATLRGRSAFGVGDRVVRRPRRYVLDARCVPPH